MQFDGTSKRPFGKKCKESGQKVQNYKQSRQKVQNYLQPGNKVQNHL